VQLGRASQLTTKLVLTFALIGSGWLVVRNTAIALFGEDYPEWVLRFAPPSGEALANAALARASPRSDDGLKSILFASLRRAPLSEAPFRLAAQSARNRGDETEAARLTDAVLRRQSRRADYRTEALELYVQQGRWSDVIDESLLVATMEPETAPDIVKLLTVLSQNPAPKAVLLKRLEADPRARKIFLSSLSRLQLDPALAKEVKALPVSTQRDARRAGE
jgi:hypothetical protein